MVEFTLEMKDGCVNFPNRKRSFRVTLKSGKDFTNLICKAHLPWTADWAILRCGGSTRPNHSLECGTHSVIVLQAVMHPQGNLPATPEEDSIGCH